MRYRLGVKRQPDGSYEIRVIDFLLRTGMGDVLISDQPAARPMIDTTAPAVRLDARGAFVALLDPDAAKAVFKSMGQSVEDRIKSLPTEQQAEARAQLQEVRSVDYLAARAAFPWLESVGFWSGRQLEFGKSYSETVEERYLPLGSAPGPIRVERRWRALGWAPCDGPSDAEATTSKSSGDVPRGECVRLHLVSTFTPVNPPIRAMAEGRRDPRLESEIELVTEPKTLRPHRSVVTWRNRWQDASGAENVKDVQQYRMSWTYGAPALVALKGNVTNPPNLGMPPTEPANLKPKPEWALGTPERTYIAFRTASTSGDWSTAVGLMHPEFLARVAKGIRGREPSKLSDELRAVLVGDEVTREQFDAMSDLALVLLVTKRNAEERRNPGIGWGSPLPFGPDKVALGHVEDREGRIHVVTQSVSEYQIPLEYRGSSSTVVLSLQESQSPPSTGTTDAASSAKCEPAADAHRCWRVWRDSSSEFEPLSRAQSRLARLKREAAAASAPGASPAPPAPPPAPPPLPQ